MRHDLKRGCMRLGFVVDKLSYSLFFFNDTATTEIYTLSLHDALPIWLMCGSTLRWYPSYSVLQTSSSRSLRDQARPGSLARSEEHTSELQSRQYLVCRLLLEKKKSKHLQTIVRSCFLRAHSRF